VLLGAARDVRELASRLGLAYLLGLGVVGAAVATLALLPVRAGWTTLVVVAALVVVPAALRLPAAFLAAPRRPTRRRADRVVAAAGAIALVALLVRGWQAFAVAPIEAWDGWAIWATKGRALYELGWADPVVFASAAYDHAHPSYPLLVPALEALDFTVMGGFAQQELHVQFLLFGVALVGGLGGILHDRVPALVLWPALLAVGAAPAVAHQLLTVYADIPLAAFFAVGVAAAARWLVWQERWALGVASVLFAAALLTKLEGALYVGSAFAGLAVALALDRRLRGSIRPLLVAAGAAAVPFAVWRVYVAVHGLESGHAEGFDFKPGVGPIAFRWLLAEIFDPFQWALLAYVFVAAAAVALWGRARPVATFALVTVAIPIAVLVVNYTVSPLPYAEYVGSSASRVVASLVLAAAAVTPLLVVLASSRSDREP